MPRLGREGWVNFTLIALLLGLPLAANAMGEPFYVTLATRAAILALAGVGLNVALGLGGMVSFGHAAYFGLGGYAAGILAHHAANFTPVLTWPVEIAGTTSMPAIWLVAVVVAGLIAVPIGAISLRTSGVYFIMITLAFAQMIFFLAISLPTYGGEDGLPIYLRNSFPGVNTLAPLPFFLIAYGALLVALVGFHIVRQSRFGTALQAIRQNPDRVAAIGIAPFPIRLTGLVISAMVTALAGALFADLNRFVGPTMLSWHTSGEILIFVILGGVGRTFGPVVGAGLFIVLEFYLGGLTQHWQFFLGLILLAVVLYARGGVMGLLAGKARHD
ncbi:MAG: branched-chain amino acid ABC transporter permease [Pseudomonadota bacterium]